MNKTIPLVILLVSGLALTGCTSDVSPDATVTESSSASGEPTTPVEEPEVQPTEVQPTVDTSAVVIDPNAEELDSTQRDFILDIDGSYSVVMFLREVKLVEIADGISLKGWEDETEPVGVVSYIPSEDDSPDIRKPGLLYAYSPGKTIITLISPLNPDNKITIGVTVLPDSEEDLSKLRADTAALALELNGLTKDEALLKIEESGNRRIVGFFLEPAGDSGQTKIPEYQPGLIAMTVTNGKVATARSE
jgi:hypothetical protein